MKNIFKKIILPCFIFSMVFVPILTQAQGATVRCSLATNPKIQDVFNYMSCILNLSVVPLIFSLALVYFIYGVMQYVLNDADESKKAKGKQFMVWGIVALTVMVTVWGLVNLLGNTFGVNTRIVPSVTPN
jgi:hypothetical protein